MKTSHLLLAFLCLLAAGTTAAQSFNKLADGSFQHPDSGWLFPQRVGEFEREKDPEFFGSARDGVASYTDAFEDNATVYVYSPRTDAIDASYSRSKALIEQDLKKYPLSQSWSEGPFRVGKAVPLVGEKIFFKVGIGPGSSHSYLFYFDTGPWIVKVRLSGPTADKDVFARVDGFVRELPWDSLGLAADSCTGTACRPERPMAIHGNALETIALLLVQKNVPRIFPKDAPACDPATIAAALDAEPAKGPDGTPQLINNSACVLGKATKANFIRLNLTDEITAKLGGGPDGLSLRGPISLVAVGNRKSSALSWLHDGKLDADGVSRILSTLENDAGPSFGTAKANGTDLKLVTRFLDDSLR